MRFALALIVGTTVASAAQAASAPDLIAEGEYLARVGNCISCHSTVDGKPFAGGLKMAVPHLGVIYTTNITPDKKYGIGNYTFEDFERAMRHGVAKDGHMLYPAMPYPSYAKTSDDDLRALYAFFMESVPAADVPNKPSEIPAPLNMRWPLKIWNLVFLPHTAYTPDGTKDAKWNRGAYLVEGLGHCGACHSPRGVAFQEKGLTAHDKQFLAGAELDYWDASDLRGDSSAGLGHWSESDTATFLKTGHNNFGSAFGTMIEVVNNSTQYMTDNDIGAIATYLKSLSPAGTPTMVATAGEQKTVAANAVGAGADIYARNCASCHGFEGEGHAPYLPPLAGNPTTVDGNATSLINVALNGSARIVLHGMPDAYRMPQFRVLLNDRQLADVLTFIRSDWGHGAPGVTEQKIKALRAVTDPASDDIIILRMH